MKTISPIRLLLDTPRIMRDSPGYLTELVAQHGDIVRLEAGEQVVIVVAQPEVIGHVLVENWRNYSKATPQFEMFKTVTGNGLLNSDGDFWLSQRRIQQPGFHRGILEGFAETIVREAAALGEQWQSLAGEVVDVEAEMMGLSLRVICDCLFGMDIGKYSAEYVNQFAHALDYVMFRAQLPMDGAKRLPIRVVKEYKQAMLALDGLVSGLIADRRSKDECGDDLLGMLLAARSEDGEPLPDFVIRDEVMTLIVAGYETVATGLTWLFYLLSQNSIALERVRVELATVLRGRLPTLSDLSELVALKAVVDEGFRLIPPSWLISRRALTDDKIGDLVIPGDAIVVVSPFAMHRNPRYWTDPERFWPGRFSAEKPQKYQYIPFGAGPRLCIGNRFAEMETQLVLATMLQFFNLDYAGKRPPRPLGRITVRPKGGMPMRIRPNKP